MKPDRRNESNLAEHVALVLGRETPNVNFYYATLPLCQKKTERREHVLVPFNLPSTATFEHHGACILDLGGNFRRSGRQLREYLENVWGMCQCRGACFFDVGGNISWLRETIKRICREYGGNVPASWCLLFGFGWEMFVGTGDN